MKYFLHFFCLLLLLSLLSASPAFARAGGGDSGSSGSSYSGDSSSSDSPSGSDRNTNLFLIAATILLSRKDSAYTYLCALKGRMKLLYYKKNDDRWDWNYLEQHIKNAYFEIQECWRLENPMLAQSYLSKRLLSDFEMKISLMQERWQKPVQENVELKQATPFAFQGIKGEGPEAVWVFIKGRMISYYISTESGFLVKGKRTPETFVEYWKFIYEDDQWRLDKILQKADYSIRSVKNL